MPSSQTWLRSPRLLAVTLTLPFLVACIGTPASRGELGRAEFAWQEGLFGCLFGCDAKEGMANRSVAILMVVNSSDLPAFDVASDNPSVIEFRPRGTSIECEAHQAGRAKVLLYEAGTTTLIDRFEIKARDVRRVEPNSDDLYDEQLLVQVGGDQRLYFDLRDSKGRRLRGIGGVDYGFVGGIDASEATLVDAIANFLAGIFTGENTEYVDVDALAAGSGALTVTAPTGATLSIPFGIVEATVITRIDIETSDSPSVGESLSLQASAYAGSERVHSPGCTWALSPATGVAEIESSSRDFVTILAIAPGTVTVSCTAGTVTGALGVVVR